MEVGLEDAKVDACDLRCWWLEKLCSRAEKQNKLLLSLLCEIKSQLFVYNFKTIKIIIYVSLERSDPYDLCYYCSCQMRLLENLYWKNVNLQKKIFFSWNWKIAIIWAILFFEIENEFEMILEKISCCYLVFSENMNHLITYSQLF